MGSLIASDQEKSASASKPENHDEIKALLEGYASAADTYVEIAVGKKELLAQEGAHELPSSYLGGELPDDTYPDEPIRRTVGKTRPH